MMGVPLPKNPKKNTLIVVYHGISLENPTKYNSRFVSLQDFKNHLDFFSKSCHVISLKDIGKKNNPHKLNIVITFDDGYLNNYLYAFPLLKEKNIPASFCISTQTEFPMLWADFIDILAIDFPTEILQFNNQRYTIGKDFNVLKTELIKATSDQIRDFFSVNNSLLEKINKKKDTHDFWKLLSVENIREMVDHPLVEIVPHGHLHLSLKHTPDQDIDLEINSSIQAIKDITQQPVKRYAIPFGFYKKDIIEKLKNTGISTILLLEKNKKSSQIDGFERFIINPHISFPLLKRFLFKGNYF